MRAKWSERVYIRLTAAAAAFNDPAAGEMYALARPFARFFHRCVRGAKTLIGFVKLSSYEKALTW